MLFYAQPDVLKSFRAFQRKSKWKYGSVVEIDKSKNQKVYYYTTK